MFKKTTILFIATTLSVASAFAQFGGGSGTSPDPYQIKTVGDLTTLRNNVNGGNDYNDKFFKLMNNLDLNYAAWTPIGTSDARFKGNFDGGDKVISNLWIGWEDKYVGLFGYVDGGVIENLGVENADVYGGQYVGIVVGYMSKTIRNCYSTGWVDSYNDAVGGVVGSLSTAGSIMENCYSTAVVYGEDRVGGVAGSVFKSKMSNCYSTGYVEGNNDVGGVVGQLTRSSTPNEAAIIDCAALNPCVDGSGSNVGRVLGRAIAAGTGSSYTLAGNIAFDGIKNNAGNTNWNNIGADKIDGANISKTTINADGTLGNRFTSAGGWKTQNGELPGLFGNTVEMPYHLFIMPPFSGGNGSSGNPYIITTPQQLHGLAMAVNADDDNYNSKYYQLGNDISLAGYQWTPIGASINFYGSFDGNNNKITNLFINRSFEAAGLFGGVINGTIKNLGVEDVNISGIHVFVGGIVGGAMESKITNCYFTGNVGGGEFCGGGIVGYVLDCNITNCYSTGEVSGEFCGGGIAGGAIDCNITNCYSTGNVNGVEYVGGIVGGGSFCEITNCYSTGEVSGVEDVGGIVGYILESEITNCAALNISVKGTTHAGRVVGQIDGTNTLSNNIAFEGMLNKAGNTNWDYIGGDNLDGANISKTDINADGTLGGRFTSSVWTTASGKLPGLFGNTVEMPEHLRIGESIVETQCIASLQIYPNPVNYELKITNYEGGEVTIYDIKGRRVATAATVGAYRIRPNENGTTTINVEFLPPGVYFLKIGNKTAKFVKQ